MALAPDPTKPFDRCAVRRHRDRAALRFDAHGFLFDEVGARLLDRLADFRRSFPRVLELGCRNGRLSPQLAVIGSKTFIRTDFSEAMAHAAKTGHPGPQTLVADEEMLPFADSSFDLVVSNLALHWVNDLPGALAQIRRILRPDGLLLASLFGGDTLNELRDSLLAADVAVSDGATPRVSPFCDVRDAAHLLARAGFALPVADVDRIAVTYPDALALMRELRGMSETSALALRQRNFTRRATILNACDHYAKNFAATEEPGRITASFEAIYLTAWSPHESQQKPLQPGTATARLADALDSQEQLTDDPARPNPTKR